MELFSFIGSILEEIFLLVTGLFNGIFGIF